MVSRAYEEDLAFHGNKVTSAEEGPVICRIDCFGEIEERENHLFDIFLEKYDKHLNCRRCNKVEGMDS